ncbi:hypothetical protein [Oerskovia enterophila]|uniref:Uncharacterized protein n=1 Tax=Oerskovia enterophila TaxID=43678 RepID=A0A163QTV5_9CELL|nr:hypothetical protein [Oerskovia enterophila]KZM34523.1 hypothetical protein OJAG_28220 [Oerskovia enterophila]
MTATGVGRLEPSPAGFTSANVVDGPLLALDPNVVHAATMRVCARATSPDDARALLTTLGILQEVAA